MGVQIGDMGEILSTPGINYQEDNFLKLSKNGHKQFTDCQQRLERLRDSLEEHEKMFLVKALRDSNVH